MSPFFPSSFSFALGLLLRGHHSGIWAGWKGSLRVIMAYSSIFPILLGWVVWWLAAPHLPWPLIIHSSEDPFLQSRNFPGGTSGKEPTRQCRRRRDVNSFPSQEDSLEKGRQSTPVLLPGESDGHRKVAGYNPWGHKESDTTEATQHTSPLLWTTFFTEDIVS